TDVTDWESVSSTVQFARTSMGRIDVLVNCAGWTVDRLFTDKPRAEWEREIAIDTWGFINCVRAVLDPMMERGYGRIVSIGSDAGGRRAGGPAAGVGPSVVHHRPDAVGQRRLHDDLIEDLVADLPPSFEAATARERNDQRIDPGRLELPQSRRTLVRRAHDRQ